jgi:hypothetical protein
MAHPPTEEDTLDQLQTPEQVALLDTIDELRNQGLGHHGINLPQLIVCGDQSSGKVRCSRDLQDFAFLLRIRCAPLLPQR